MHAVASPYTLRWHSQDHWMLLEQRTRHSKFLFPWRMYVSELLQTILTSYQPPAQSSNMLSSGQETGLVICRRSYCPRDPIVPRAADHQGRPRLQGYPRKITRSTSTLAGLSLLTLWSSSDSGARHLSRSQLRSMRDEHARPLLKDNYPVRCLFFQLVSSPLTPSTAES